MYHRPFPNIRPRCVRKHCAQEQDPSGIQPNTKGTALDHGTAGVLLHPSAVVADRRLSPMGIAARNRVCQGRNHTQTSTTFTSAEKALHSSLASHMYCPSVASTLISIRFVYHRKELWCSAALSRPREEPSRHNRH